MISLRLCVRGAALLAALAAMAPAFPAAAVLERTISVGTDDAEESVSGIVSLFSTDLELTYDGGHQTVGLRFTGVAVPAGATIGSAWVQFHVDEADGTQTDLILRAEASDDAPPLLAIPGNLSSRPATFASVSWSPAAWVNVEEAGADQRTPDLSAVLQEVVGRAGWRGDGSLLLLIGGTGRRVAVSRDGRAASAPLLHVEYSAAANTAPRVDAGPDRVIGTGATTVLKGSVADDGVPLWPGTVLAQWRAIGGDGPVSFEDPFSPETTVTFPAPGSYVLRLEASDGALTATDEVIVTASEEAVPPPDGTILSPPGPLTVVAGTLLDFQGTAVEPRGGLPLRFSWDFGGAAPPRRVEDPGPTLLAVPGVYTVRFTVTDDRELADPTPAARVVTVVPAPGSRTLYVSPAGNDLDDGSLERPFRTISRAADELLPGDRLLLRHGTYAERVTVRASGTPLAPIVIDSYPGERAVIDSAIQEFRVPGNEDWELVDAQRAEYRSVNVYPPGNPRGFLLVAPGAKSRRVGLVPYQSAEAFRSPGTQYVDEVTPFYVGPGLFQEADGRIHIRLSKTPEMVESEARGGPVLPGGAEDPRAHPLLISNVSGTLTVKGSYLVIRNITLQMGTRTIQLSEGAHHVVFDGVTAWGGASALAVTAPGVSDIHVVNARLYADIPPWIAWSDAKNAPAPANLIRGTLVNLAHGARDVTISYSHLRGGGDGVGVDDSEDNVVVHHCRLEDFMDDAFEIEGTLRVGRIEIHDNYIANSLTAIAPGQSTLVFDGPLLVYRNIVALLRPPFVNRMEGLNEWNGGGRFGYEYLFKHADGESDNSRNVHIYHNTLLLLGSPGPGINITPGDPADTRIANNILMTVNGEVNRDFRQAPGQVLDGNLYWKANTADGLPLLGGVDTVGAFHDLTGLEEHGVGSIAGSGNDPRFTGLLLDVEDPLAPVWALRRGSDNQVPGAFFLSPGSPAIGSGITIPPHPLLGELPGSIFSRDIGALPFGSDPDQFRIFPFLSGPVHLRGSTPAP